MAQTVFTNTHIHIFTDKCVSKNFLRVIPQKLVRKLAPQILKMIDTSFGRLTIKLLAKAGRNKNAKNRTMTDKTISFLNIALQATQEEVLEIEFETARQYDASARIVALTMNMDYMDDIKPAMLFETQLLDVKNIKTHNPKTFLPFLGVDPRHKTGEDAVAWAKNFFEKGVQAGTDFLPYFSGIKLYPALGFFPFDPKLDELYDYAQKNAIPVLTHCTRVGNQYIGSNIESLIPKDINLLLPDTGNPNTDSRKKNIQSRITQYYEKNWIKNNKTGNNDYACDLFGHPENYIPLLEKFPDLKICLAHIGGSNEIYCNPVSKELTEVRSVDPYTWYERILEMMKVYPNLYTDISYTLSSLDDEFVCKKIIDLFEATDLQHLKLYKRVLFGTDFFMTEQEMREVELYALAKEKLATYWYDLTVTNPVRFLGM